MKLLNRYGKSRQGIGTRLLLVFVLMCFCFATMGISLDDCDDCCADGHCEECLIGNCCFVQPAIITEHVSITPIETPPSNQQVLTICEFDSPDIVPPDRPPRLS